MNKGKLYIVSLPIGNSGDITERALEVLKRVDVIIAEENASVKKLFSAYKFKKEYFVFNEHNEQADADFVIEFLEKGEDCALISDCGTPVFADPGQFLIKHCYAKNIQVVPVPGASSLMSLLAVSPINIKKFFFAGFLPKKQDERILELKKLRALKQPVVIMDTPYRLIAVLEDVAKIFDNQKILFLYKATMDEEVVKYDISSKILKFCKSNELKGEFMLMVES